MKRRLAIAIGLLSLAALTACGDGESPTSDDRRLFVPMNGPTVEESGPTSADWVYWLSDINLDAIAAAAPEIAVIDYSQDGGEDTEFSAPEIDHLRDAMTGDRLVISYMSIGEAEDYRYYWQDSWMSDRPEWLDEENRNWPGNYKVRFWDPDWQRRIFGTPDSYLDKIVAAGFDGVYLDIIDAYDYFTKKGRESAEDEMVQFVSAISQYAKDQKPDFLILPQNAPELGVRPDYLAVVDGIGMEGVYFGWDEPNVATNSGDTEWLEGELARFANAGKIVLAVDYASASSDVTEAYRRSREQGFRSTVTHVDLDRLPAEAP